MEGKSNSGGNRSNQLMMGDVVLSPSPSPLHQQNFGGEPHSQSPRSSGTTSGTTLEIVKSVVRMPSITFEKVITSEQVSGGQESEEDLQEQLLGGNGGRRKSFRKRKKSIHGGGIDSNYMPPYKQRRMFIRRHISCPSGTGGGKTPLKFLLGGNAHDPLNLNGLGDSDNAVTPKTSPMTFPSSHNSGQIPIMIPKNYQDPLRLLSEEDVENTRDVIEGILSVPTPTAQPSHPHKRRRHRRRSLRKRNASECSVESVATDEEDDVETVAATVIAENDIKELRDDDEVDTNVVHQHSITDIQTKEATDEADDDKEKKAEIEGSSASQPMEQEETNVSSSAVPAEKSDSVVAERETFRVSSDYIPLSSHYQPSPFVLDTMNENFTVLPFESPSMSNYMGTQDTFTITEPFSPPPRPMDVMIEHRVPSGHYGLGCTPPRNEIQQRRQLPPQPSVQQQAMFNRRYRNRLDPIVSPVFPNLTTGKRSWASHPHGHLRHHHKKQQHHLQEPKIEEKKEIDDKEAKKEDKPKQLQKYHPKNQIFRYGNYNRYYGYRNAGQAEDARLRAFKKEWIEGKDVLDIGCNVGDVTLCLGRDFGPRRIVGIDIDGYLIKMANKNIKHYVDRDPNDVSVKFPLSLSIVHGSLQPPQLEADVGKTPEYGGGPNATPTSTSGSQGERKRILFPYNVGFRQENYVLDHDDLLTTVKPQYDCIVCLSTTKWVHLNFGDDGLKRFFRRAFMNLRPGGVFVLEPQPWSSYRKKKKLTPEISKNFQSIKFFPKDFETFLLKEVGYSSVKLIGIPAHHSKGFQRPIYVFNKGATTGKTPTATITTEEPVETSTSGTTQE